MRIHLVLRNMCKVLNVAEKNDAAKNIANIMSNGSMNKVNNYPLNLLLFNLNNFREN